MARERRAGVEHREVVGDNRLSGPHREPHAQVVPLGGRLEQVEGLALGGRDLDVGLHVGGDLDELLHVPATEQSLADAEHRDPPRGHRRAARLVLAETVVPKAPVEDGEQVRPGRTYLLVHGVRAHEPALAALRRRGQAEEGQQVRRVAVGRQLGPVAVGPGVRVHVGDVDDAAEALPHDALRHGPTESEADAPEERRHRVGRKAVDREAPQQDHASAVKHLVADRLEGGGEVPHREILRLRLHRVLPEGCPAAGGRLEGGSVGGVQVDGEGLDAGHARTAPAA